MQSNIMTRKKLVITALLMSSLSTASCTQMMRHSNTLVFGTDTNWGIKLGQDVNQIPSIEIGYGRQEAAFVPLLANSLESTSNGKNLAPCDPGSNEACHFIASHDGVDKDSYSTIASFGSKVGTSNGPGNQAVDVAIAQYFATGIAAQHLVLTGGANIIQAGGDTKAKADAAERATEEITAAQLARSRAAATHYDQGKTGALAIMGGDNGANVDTSSSTFALLHQRMGNGCTPNDVQSELSGTDQSKLAANTLSVGDYLDVIRNEIPSCLDNLISE